MPAPSQLVFTHFPDDPDWQLLERPIDLDEFESLVPLKPTFFKYGLHLLSHTNGVIECPPGHDIGIRIECPKAKVIKPSSASFFLPKSHLNSCGFRNVPPFHSPALDDSRSK